MISTAIILAARRERDSEMPYPLKSFAEGVTLLGRSIAILREAGIQHIIVVAGYQAEQFESYQADDVEIIVNANYEFTSSMGSLALVKDCICGDFLLIEGDTFYEKEVIQKLAERTDGNCFTMTEESGSGDECFVETKAGFILKITKDRHRVCRFEGELLGLSRISKSTFNRLMEAWEASSNSYLNYEYLLMDVTDAIDRPVLKFQNLIWGEVDNEKDFRRLQNDTYPRLRRKEDPFDKENLMKYLSDIFPGEDVSQAEIIQIGGMSNKNFRVNYKGRSYVLRVPGNASDGMVERSNEEYNAIEGVKMGVNPDIRYFDAKTGIKLADYVENAETLNAATIQRHDNLRKIADIYHRIHDAHVRLKNEFNLFQEIEKYDRLIEKVGATMYEGWDEFKPKVMSLESRLNAIGIEMTPCHDDAVPENFIKAEDGTIYLIDWEYSGMNDPMADFAALFLESDFPEDTQDYFLDKYYSGNVPDGIKERILCYEILWDALWAQWTVIKEACGEDFGSYGIDRYNRAKTNFNKL